MTALKQIEQIMANLDKLWFRTILAARYTTNPDEQRKLKELRQALVHARHEAGEIAQKVINAEALLTVID